MQMIMGSKQLYYRFISAELSQVIYVKHLQFWIMYSFARAVIAQYSRVGGLNTDFYFVTVLQARSLSSKCQPGCFYRRSLFPACRGCLCFPCVFAGSFLCGSLCLTFVLIRTPVVGLGPTLMTSFKVTHLFEDAIARYSHTLRY